MDLLLALLPLALLGALLGLDVVSFPQAMISRPIVAATLGGALVGRPMQGLLIGAVLELFALETLPFGASRYPEWGSASVVGGALLAMYPVQVPGSLPVVVMVALFTAWFGGRTMVWLRKLNATLARRNLAALDAGSGSTVVKLQLAGLWLDLLRGFVLTLAALLLFMPATRWVLANWTLGDGVGRAVTVSAASAVAAAAVWKLFHAAAGARFLMTGGLVAGLAIAGLIW